MEEIMKVVRLHAYGGLDVLVFEDSPRPEPGLGEVLVRVHAAGVNPIDWRVREGYMQAYFGHTLPLILGWAVSGTVAALGRGIRVWTQRSLRREGGTGHAQRMFDAADTVPV